MIKALLDAFPSGASQLDLLGRTPLHEAVTHGASVAAVELLVAAFPGAALIHDRKGKGKMPLHRPHKTTAGAVAAIIRAAPSAAAAQDGRRRLPLHVALQNGCSVEIVATLLEAFPPAVTQRDLKTGDLPLHAVLSSMSYAGAASEALVQLLLRANTSACAERTTLHRSRLPLHLAVANGRSVAVVTALLEAFPAATRLTDSDGKTPLHLLNCVASSNKSEAAPSSAAAAAASVEVARLLLAADPSAAAVMDATANKNLPLHAFLERHSVHASVPDDAVALVLIEAHPAACSHANARTGSLPLHRLPTRASAALVAALLAACPSAVSTPNLAGELPLHVAVTRGVCAAAVEALLAAHPAAAAAADAAGRLPLNRISAHFPPCPAAIAAVLSRFPEAAAAVSSPAATSATAVFSTPPVGLRFPLHFAAAACTASCPEVVLLLLAAHPQAAAAADAAGLLPLHLAIASRGVEVGVVNALLAAAPEAARTATADTNRAFPLHIALAWDPFTYGIESSEINPYSLLRCPHTTGGGGGRGDKGSDDGIIAVVAALIAAAPEVVRAADCHGDTPLHVLVSGDGLEFKGESATLVCILDALVSADPSGPSTRSTANRRLPLHYACYSMLPEREMVKGLLKAYPPGVADTGGKDGLTPLDLLIEV